MTRKILVSLALLAGTTTLSFAQQQTNNLEKLGSFKTTGTTEFTQIEQGGLDRADFTYFITIE